MSDPQIFILVIGVLLTALVTLLLGQVTGMRSDLRLYIAKQDDINNRLTTLEAKHDSNIRYCQGIK